MAGRLPNELKNRAKRFAYDALDVFEGLLKQNEIARIVGRQMFRSGTAVAAHLREASQARSRAEFLSKMGGAAMEVDECAMWFEMLRDKCGILHLDGIIQEAYELPAIFNAIIRNSK